MRINALGREVYELISGPSGDRAGRENASGG